MGILASVSLSIRTMNLNLFPPTIAELERSLLKQNQVVRELKDRLDIYDWQLDMSIAFDPELKNDLQRRVKRLELTVDDEVYQKMINELCKAIEAVRLVEIDLDLTKNQFTVVKLETRERIARMEGRREH